VLKLQFPRVCLQRVSGPSALRCPEIFCAELAEQYQGTGVVEVAYALRRKSRPEQESQTILANFGRTSSHPGC